MDAGGHCSGLLSPVERSGHLTLQGLVGAAATENSLAGPLRTLRILGQVASLITFSGRRS